MTLVMMLVTLCGVPRVAGKPEACMPVPVLPRGSQVAPYIMPALSSHRNHTKPACREPAPVLNLLSCQPLLGVVNPTTQP